MKTAIANLRGFTLIELMVVMAIIAILMSLVGPLVVNSLQKSQAKVEVMTIKRWSKNISIRAFMTQQVLLLELNGKSAKLINEQNVVIKSVDFEYLYFQPQSIEFNSNGYALQGSLQYQLKENRFEFSLEQGSNSMSQYVSR
ncbi:prepilin-type N-terminal cleavage/methylation domain-containing protein [Paraglaciecola sp.]|uniref:prepilin-type N-terminal cleavage/methylation domain-containing protein n=1 Tax=Paraglaciecola sp. TaxID=1920173 RepID=UPI003EF09FD4